MPADTSDCVAWVGLIITEKNVSLVLNANCYSYSPEFAHLIYNAEEIIQSLIHFNASQP